MPLTKEATKQLMIGTPIVIHRTAWRVKKPKDRPNAWRGKHDYWWHEWVSTNFNPNIEGIYVGWKRGLNGWCHHDRDEGFVFEPSGPGVFLLRFRRSPGEKEELAFPADCDVNFEWDKVSKVAT